MIQKAEDREVSDIFNVDKKHRYYIPKYQREYAWKRDNWETLITDLIENNKGQFLGSIVFVDKNTDSYEDPIFEVIDGQQRLTTISLLYLAVYDVLTKISDEKKLNYKELSHELYKLECRLIQKKDKTKFPRLTLSEQNKNNKDYLKLLSDSKIIDPNEEKNNNFGNRRISKAHKFFFDKICDKKEDDLLDLLGKLNEALLVTIQVKTLSDAFTLFESLNNRGMPLSAVDLIKNNFLSKLEKTKGFNIDDSFDKWQSVLSNLEDEQTQVRFLRQYYNAFKHKPEISIKGTPKATKSNLINIYDELITRDPQWLFEDIIEKSKHYNELIDPNPEDYLHSSLQDLLNINGATSNQLLLYLKSEGTDNEIMKNTIDFLVKYFVRRNLTDFPATRDLDSIFMNLIDILEKKDASIEIIESFLTEQSKISSLDDFKTELSKDLYEINRGVTKFILSKIEEHNSTTKETDRGFWKQDKGKSVWTVEHIFPQGQNIPKDWVDMIADGDETKAKQIQEELADTIGNLTLTCYNPKLSNKPFKYKRDLEDKKGEKIGYKNRLYLNNELARTDVWNKETIIKRSNILIEEALALFKFKRECEKR